MEGEKQMTPDRIDLYRRLIDTQRGNDDPLLLVNREELAALLDCYQWHQTEKPRVRRQARLTEPELAE